MRIKTSIMLFTVMLVGTAFAGDKGGNSCKLEGTWYGEDFFLGSFSIQYHGEGNSTGTLDMEITRFNEIFDIVWPELGGASHLRGNWKQTGGNSYSFVRQQTWYDDFGAPAAISRQYGTMRFTDCNTLEARYTYLKVFDLDMELISEEPSDTEGYPPAVAHRLLFMD